MLKQQLLYSTVLFFKLFLNGVSLVAGNQQQLAEVMLREIGNDFLLELGDSTSRILPIEMNGESYVLKFDRNFSFNPEVLISIARDALQQFDTQSEWLVKIETCDSSEVVHSFQSSASKNVHDIACLQRELPLDCYYFTFSNLTHAEQQLEPSKNPIEQKPTSRINEVMFGVILIIGLILGFTFLVKYIKSRKYNPYKRIGKFDFDENKMILTLNRQTIELSGKESELLSLLHQHKNKTLGRDKILREVWGDEGDYVGRTLDVYISKLRKKLVVDETVEIVNIRGIGYRLVIPYK